MLYSFRSNILKYSKCLSIPINFRVAFPSLHRGQSWKIFCCYARSRFIAYLCRARGSLACKERICSSSTGKLRHRVSIFGEVFRNTRSIHASFLTGTGYFVRGLSSRRLDGFPRELSAKSFTQWHYSDKYLAVPSRFCCLGRIFAWTNPFPLFTASSLLDCGILCLFYLCSCT